MKPRYLLFAFTACFAGLAMTVQAQARTLYWDGSASSQWSNPENWSEFSSDGTLTPLVSGDQTITGDDVAVLVAGKANDPSDQNIPGLVIEGLWFGPSTSTITVGSTNGSSLGIRSGGPHVLDNIDFAGSVAAEVDLTGSSTTVSVVDTQLDDTSEAAALLHAVEVGTVLSRGDPDGLEVASVNPAAGTFTVTVAPGSTSTGAQTWFPTFFDVNIPVELHGNDNTSINALLGRTGNANDGQEVIDIEFSKNASTDASSDIVGLNLLGNEDIPRDSGNWGFSNGEFELTNANSDFIGPLQVNTTNGGWRITSLANAGEPSAAGAGDSLSITGQGGGRIDYAGGDVTTDRTLFVGHTFQQTDSNATINWTGIISLTNGGPKNFSVQGTWNVSGDITGDSNFTVEGGNWSFIGDKTYTGAFKLQSGTANFTNFQNAGIPSSLGAGDTFEFDRFVGGNMIFIGTTDQSSDRNWFWPGDNVRPTIRNNSPNGSTLTINGFMDNNLDSFDFREIGFDAELGDIILNGPFYTRDDGNGGYQVNNGSGTVFINAPGGANGRMDMDGNAVVPATNVAEPDVVVTVQATVPGAASFTEGDIQPNVDVTVDDTTGLKLGMLAIHPNLVNQGRDDDPFGMRSMIKAIDFTNDVVTLSTTPSADITSGEQITFIGYQPLGYDRIDIGSTGTLTVNTTLGNVDLNTDLGALNIDDGGTLTGEGAWVPFRSGETMNSDGGGNIAPGNSIGTFTFGSSSSTLSGASMTGNFQMEISTDAADQVTVWMDGSNDVDIGGADFVVTNIGSGPPDAGDYVLLDVLSGGFSGITGTPNLQLVGNFTDRSADLVLDGFPPTQIILSIEVSADGATAFETFADAFGVSADPTSDTDGDGVALIDEFIGNTDPTLASDVPTIEFIIVDDGGTDYPAIRFTRPEAGQDATAVGEVDEDLTDAEAFDGPSATPGVGEGTTLDATEATGIVGIDGSTTYETVVYRSNESVDALPEQFLRIASEITLP